jgi:hypothetical protein
MISLLKCGVDYGRLVYGLGLSVRIAGCPSMGDDVAVMIA